MRKHRVTWYVMSSMMDEWRLIASPFIGFAIAILLFQKVRQYFVKKAYVTRWFSLSIVWVALFIFGFLYLLHTRVFHQKFRHRVFITWTALKCSLTNFEIGYVCYSFEKVQENWLEPSLPWLSPQDKYDFCEILSMKLR